MDQIPPVCFAEDIREKEALKDDLAAAEAKLASNDTELFEAHEEVSRVHHEQ